MRTVIHDTMTPAGPDVYSVVQDRNSSWYVSGPNGSTAGPFYTREDAVAFAYAELPEGSTVMVDGRTHGVVDSAPPPLPEVDREKEDAAAGVGPS